MRLNIEDRLRDWKLFRDAQIIAIVCNQTGDSGKGKISDLLIRLADVSYRGQGGANAGHTVYINNLMMILHETPTGYMYDNLGKISACGQGMVLNPIGLAKELDALATQGFHGNHFMISEDAHVVMPYHIEEDQLRNQSQANGGIGSTGRGIGPAYRDKTDRIGIRIGDLYDQDILRGLLVTALKSHPHASMGPDEIMALLKPAADRIKQYVCDTTSALHRFVREGKKIILEGSQGAILDVSHGTYRYVTSCSTTVNGLADGAGIGANQVGLTLGILKFPLSTKVGGGPSPTEVAGIRSEQYCAQAGHANIDELRDNGIPFTETAEGLIYDPMDPKITRLMDSDDELERSIGYRLRAREYGATSGRPRRMEYFDAVAARYVCGINGPHLVITKPDVFAGMDNIKICYGYERDGVVTETYNKREEVLRKVKPVFRTYQKYDDIRGIQEYDELPQTLLNPFSDIERFIGGHIDIVSTGPKHDETILR